MYIKHNIYNADTDVVYRLEHLNVKHLNIFDL